VYLFILTDLTFAVNCPMDSSDFFPIERSSLFQFYAAERVEIDRVKWLESERMGRDCGYYHAQWIWMTTERPNWIKQMRAEGKLPRELG
jgi:hypothetical protein